MDIKRYILKFQGVVGQNGLITNLFEPVERKKHDSGMLADSILLNLLGKQSFDTAGNPLRI